MKSVKYDISHKVCVYIHNKVESKSLSCYSAHLWTRIRINTWDPIRECVIFSVWGNLKLENIVL